jgi:CDP-diacylglycerol--glycerol-3-phosphate 3-phosphatidyltransferase
MANLITALRIPLLVLIIALQYVASPAWRLFSVLLVVLLIAMDMVDGMVARKRHEVSLMGSVLDIMADRAVELVMWVIYAHLGLISVAIPVIFILRGTIVDALRSVHVSAGTAPFKVMRSRLGKWLVGSPFMRTPYGIAKMLAFAGLALANALAAYAQAGQVTWATVAETTLAFNIISWIATLFCLVRGLPVIVEAIPSLVNTAPALDEKQT